MDVIVGWLTWKCLSCLRLLVVLNNILIDDGLFPPLKKLESTATSASLVLMCF